MILITRCPACQTMFKVVADQFKAAQGWVRCGYCGEVFDAALHQVAPESAAQETQPQAEQQVEPVGAAQQAPQDGVPPKEAASLPAGLQALPVDVPLQLAPESGQPALAVPASAEPDTNALKLTQAQEAAASKAAKATANAAMKAEAPAQAAPEVSFVRDARRKAFWKRPLVRLLLGLLSLVLLTALLLQWVLQQKDNLAAMDPRLAPVLQTLCDSLDCEIRPPRHIESVVIDSSNFSKTGPDVYRLSFVLKNTSAARLETPSVEITLTDVQEQALVRRVLTPQQFGAAALSLAAHAELAGVVTLKVSGELVPGGPPSPPLPINGYRILAFYP